MKVNVRIPLAVIATAILASCASQQPYMTSRTVTASPPETVYNCALNFVVSRGYTVESANKESGFFKAVRSERKGASSIHWGQTVNEELTIVVLPAQPIKLQVTAAANISEGRGLRLLEPTPEARGDADNVLATCAK